MKHAPAVLPTFNVVTPKTFGTSLRRLLKDLPRDYVGTLADIQRRCGDLVHLRMFGGLLNFAFISDARTNRELYVRNTDALAKSPSQIQTFLYAAGPSVATAQGDDWRSKRKEANTLFSRLVIEASCAGQIKVVRSFINGLDNTPQDAMTMARRMAALTSSRAILGRDISVAEADTQIAFSKAAGDRFNTESAHIFARPHWMLAPWRKELTRRKAEVLPIAQKAIDDLRSSDADNDGLMSHYMKGDFATSGPEGLLVIAVGFLMGAQDNIASATGWVLAYLAHHGNIQDQIRREIRAASMDAAGLESCKMLKATVAEVLRIRPPAQANQPRILKSAVEIAGHKLPKGTFVLNSFYNMHHAPEAYENPDLFDPTRFLAGDLDRSVDYAPFGHGPRNCVAQGMARQQLMALVAGLLADHRLSCLTETFPEIRQTPFLVPSPFKVRVEQA